MQLEAKDVFVERGGVVPQQLVQVARLLFGCGAVADRGDSVIKFGRWKGEAHSRAPSGWAAFSMQPWSVCRTRCRVL